jgi:ATP:corrinoid adenosyltransferase
MPRPEEDEDIVDRIKGSATTDPLTIEAMHEVIRIRREMARIIRTGNQIQQELELCKSQQAKQAR